MRRIARMEAGRRLELPFVPGSDASGVIVAVGSAVDGFKSGDEVFTSLTFSATARAATRKPGRRRRCRGPQTD